MLTDSGLCLASGLLYATLRKWEIPLTAALTAALLFAVHPIHTEVVNEVVGRSELLVACLILTAFFLAQGKSRLSQWGICLCYVLALLSKENAVVFPLILFIWKWFKEGFRVSYSSYNRVYAALITVTIIWLLWRNYGVVSSMPKLQYVDGLAPMAFVDVTTRIISSIKCQWLYVYKLVFPNNLQAVYSTSDLSGIFTSPFAALSVLTFIVTGSCLAMLVIGFKKRSQFCLFMTLYIVSFIPTSNIMHAIGVTMAERLAYLPSVWLCAAMSVMVSPMLSVANKKKAGVIIIAAYLFFLAGLTIERNRHFSSEIRLWTEEVKNNSHDYIGWMYLANSYFRDGMLEQAENAYEKMVQIAPDFVTGLRVLTKYYIREGLYGQALDVGQRAYDLSRTKGDKAELAFDAFVLSKIYIDQNQCDQALLYLDGPALLFSDQDPYKILHSQATSMCE